MDTKTYISLGILELYVAGTLSEKEMKEVYENSLRYPEIKKEIAAIEKTVLQLTAATAPLQSVSFQKIEVKIQSTAKVIPLQTNTKNTHWFDYVGWAATVLLTIGLSYLYVQNENLQNQINATAEINKALELQIVNARENSEEILAVFRDNDILKVNLGGQKVAPNAYANVFWNKDKNTVFIDAAGLPKPPKGKVYQVWSLTLDPLSPTSIGLLDDFEADENKVFQLANANASQAFGITLEPAGGSKSPTLEQLFTLGVVKENS
jgi:anti-sigma-K factor RskA